MPRQPYVDNQTVDQQLKSLLVLARTVVHILEDHAVRSATSVSLSDSKVQVLRLLDRQGAQSSSQIAKFLGVSKPAVTQIIDSMVRGRLVSRKMAKHDRREIVLTLSAKGRECFQAVRRKQRNIVRSMVKDLKPRDMARLSELLQKCSTSLAKANGRVGGTCFQCGVHDDGACVLTGSDLNCDYLNYVHQRTSQRTRD